MSHRSNASARGLFYAAAVAMPLASFAVAAHAGVKLPTGGQVVGGSATISQTSATQMQITSTTARSAIAWQDFSIGSGYGVNVTQPAGGTQLEQVTGTNVSQIFGSLTSNGSIVVANPNGIWFGRHAQIDVAGLAAVAASPSAAGVANFLSGGRLALSRAGNANAAIVNQGAITIANAGLAAFVAPGVRNTGIIQAKLGTVQFSSGTTATLDFYGDGLVSIAVSGPALAQAIDPSTGKLLGSAVGNTGTLNADGGTVLVTAGTAANIVNDAINVAGVVQAQGVTMEAGEIVLGGKAGVVAGPGGITLTSAAGPATIGAPLTTQAGDISVVGSSVAVDAALTNGGALAVTAADGDITQSAPLTVAGTSTFTTAAANKTITLRNQRNALSGAVTLHTAGAQGNASLANNATGGTTLANATVGGNLAVNQIAASSGIAVTGTMVAGGTLAATTVNGNIALVADAALVADGAGNALILKAGANTHAGTITGGDFVNDSGPAALRTPNSGARWLVYTGDVDGNGTKVGGLVSYRERYDTAASFVPVTGSNEILYRAAPTLVVTPNAVSTRYDGVALNKAAYSTATR